MSAFSYPMNHPSLTRRPAAAWSDVTETMSDAPITDVASTACSSCPGCTARRAHIEDTSARHLIPSLCELFYDLKWVTGTGGSISIREEYVSWLRRSASLFYCVKHS